MAELLKEQTEAEYIVDLLDRQEFVDRLIDVCEVLSKNKKGKCFAINGTWGVGKSFVLDMLESDLKNILQEGNGLSKYLVFRYNCWEYDYYEEPVVALVTALLDGLDKNCDIISDETLFKTKNFLKALGGGLLSQFNEIIKSKIGIDIEQTLEVIKNWEDMNDDAISNIQEYDSYFLFRKVLEGLKETISKLAADHTIILIVDELDRCLPQYMIKVLERLHHVFTGMNNVHLVLALDKHQIEHTIKQIYGEHTDVSKYLSKFINFEINLDTGSWNDQFEQRFAEYIEQFDYRYMITYEEDIEEFKKNIFSGIEMRNSIEIVDKCHILHELLWTKEDLADYSIMCIELFLAVLDYWKVDMSGKDCKEFVLDEVFSYSKKDKIYTGLKYLIMKCKQNEELFGRPICEQAQGNSSIRMTDIWSALIACYRYITGSTRDYVVNNMYKDLDVRSYSNEFWNLQHTIK